MALSPREDGRTNHWAQGGNRRLVGRWLPGLNPVQAGVPGPLGNSLALLANFIACPVSSVWLVVFVRENYARLGPNLKLTLCLLPSFICDGENS